MEDNQKTSFWIIVVMIGITLLVCAYGKEVNKALDMPTTKVVRYG